MTGLCAIAPLALMPAGEYAFNIAMGVVAGGGVFLLIQRPSVTKDWRVRVFMAIFLCIWAPMVIGLIGAAEPERSLRTVTAFLRYPAAAIFVITLLNEATARRWMLAAAFAVTAAWCIDGIVQWIAGVNVLGFPYDGKNLTGLFHPKRIIGLLLATLVPVMLGFAWQRRRWPVASAVWAVLAMVPLVVLLGGSRTSWLMLAVAAGAWGAWRYLRSTSRYRTPMAIAVVVAAAAAVPFLHHIPGLESRLEQTKRLFSGSYEQIDQAVTGRLPIWGAAIGMWRDHPVTGVGPRGFRYLYLEYADERAARAVPKGHYGASHPHQTVLEVLVETGAVGLCGFALFWLILMSLFWRYRSEQTWPWLCAVFVAFFPLNAHMAIYGTYWSHISWWLVMVFVGMLPVEPQRIGAGPMNSGRSSEDGISPASSPSSLPR